MKLHLAFSVMEKCRLQRRIQPTPRAPSLPSLRSLEMERKRGSCSLLNEASYDHQIDVPMYLCICTAQLFVHFVWHNHLFHLWHHICNHLTA